MDWLYVVAAIILTVAVAFLLGWSETYIKGRASKAFIWVGAILLLLIVRVFDGQPFVSIALILIWILDAADHGLKHIPHWVGYTMLAFIIGYLIWRCLLL